jgi:hypothetical protein
MHFFNVQAGWCLVQAAGTASRSVTAARPVDDEAALAPDLHQLVHVQQRLQRRGRPGHLVALLRHTKEVPKRVPLHLRRPGALRARLPAELS